MTQHYKRGHREILEEFINMYRNEPCLWDVKSVEYRDRPKRRAAYKRLTEKLREIDPNADDETTLKKINSLRTNYRKEKRKIEESRLTAATDEDIYEPSLWYYNLFEFLNERHLPRKFEFHAYLPQEEESFDDHSCVESTLNEPKEEEIPLVTNKKRRNDYDEYDHFAFTIASKIRNIPDMIDREILMNSIQNLSFEFLMSRHGEVPQETKREKHYQ